MTLTRRNHGTGHTYTADGVRLPGVTTILKMAPHDALIDWAGRTTAEYALDNWDELAALRPSERLRRLNRARFEDRDTAGRRGRQVHRLAERIVQGAEVEVPEELAGHVESYLAFLEEWEPDPVATELVVCNRTVGYCGTADLIAAMRGHTWLLDLKTGRSGIFREAALQDCAYARAETYSTPPDEAEHPLAGLGIERCGAVWIRADGYDVYPLDTGEGTWAYFRHLAAIHAADEASKEWVGEAIQPLRAVTGLAG